MNRSRAGWLRRNPIVVAALLIGLAIAAALLVAQLPRPVAALATLDRCYWGWPVVVFEGDGWQSALPADVRPFAPRQIPVASWPLGMRFDESAEALLDERGAVVFRRGDRIRITGSIVRTSGDPAPCFYTLGVEVSTIQAP